MPASKNGASAPRSYASGTRVSAPQSEAELKRLLRAHGCDRIMTYEDAERAVVMFERGGRRVRISVPFPPEADFRYTPTHQRRSDAGTRKEWEDEIRRRWRALILIIKAKFEAEASGLVSFDSEWLAYLVIGDGATIGERIGPELDEATATGNLPPLLPGVASRGPIALPAAPSVRIQEG